MRQIVKLVFLLLLIPAAASSINKKKGKLIVPGRWQESVRMLPDSTVLQFTDTLFMRFRAKDSFTYRHRNGFVYEGMFKLSEDSILDMGTVRYKVLARHTDSMVLINADGIFRFRPDTSDTVEYAVLRTPDTARPVTNIDVMIGRWTVYKRASEGSGTISPSDNIRSAYITGPSTDGKQGFIYSGNDPDSQPSWYITELGGGQSLNCAGKTNRTLKVLRCQDGEMILQENNIKYYFKLYR